MMRAMRIKKKMLVSFDVSSLFTNIPVDKEVFDNLPDDQMLRYWTTLSPDRVTELSEMCLRSTYVSYGEAFFEHK